MNVIFKCNRQDWREAGLAKRELSFYRKRNVAGKFDSAIEKEEAIIKSFTRAA